MKVYIWREKNKAVMNAIVIGNDHYNTLGVIRSLGEEHNNIFLILVGNEKSFIKRSKYINKIYFVQETSRQIIEKIEAISENIEETYYLFPTSDFVAEVLDEHYKEFANNIICPNALGKLQLYQNKRWMNRFAEKLGLKVPKQCVMETKNKEHDWNIFPAILKPVISTEGKKADIQKVENEKDLRVKLDYFHDNGYDRILVEEYIYGQDEHMVEVLGYSRKNYEVEIVGIIEKIREYPLKNGSTSYAKIIPNHSKLDLEIVKNFVKELKFFGIFDIEFKFSGKELYFIEINFRNGAPSYIMTCEGGNIPFFWMKNKEVKKRIDSMVYFMCEQNDVLHVIKGDINVLRWLKEFFCSKKIFLVWNDYKPSLAYYHLLFKIFKKRRI